MICIREHTLWTRGEQSDHEMMPEFDDTSGRTFHTWSGGNPHLAETLPKPAPLLKPGEGFLSASEQRAAEGRDRQPEDDPYHPDYGSTRAKPIRDMLDPEDPCFEFYRPWLDGYQPALTFQIFSTPDEEEATMKAPEKRKPNRELEMLSSKDRKNDRSATLAELVSVSQTTVTRRSHDVKSSTRKRKPAALEPNSVIRTRSRTRKK